MNTNSIFLGYFYPGYLRGLAFLFFVTGFIFFFYFMGTSELMALAVVLMLAGGYFGSVRTFLRKKGNCFKLETETFFLISSGKWINQNRYPLTSLKTVHKTYEMPRAMAIFNHSSVFVKDRDHRVVLTDANQRRVIALKDFPKLEEATKFINDVNQFLETEFAIWGSRMRK